MAAAQSTAEFASASFSTTTIEPGVDKVNEVADRAPVLSMVAATAVSAVYVGLAPDTDDADLMRTDAPGSKFDAVT